MRSIILLKKFGIFFVNMNYEKKSGYFCHREHNDVDHFSLAYLVFVLFVFQYMEIAQNMYS